MFHFCLSFRIFVDINIYRYMKKGLVFILGMIAGALLTIIVVYRLGSNSSDDGTGGSAPYGDSGISLFSEPGEVMTLKSFKLFQVLSNGTALAESTEKANVQYPALDYGDPIVLLLPEDGMAYYDDQVIKVPAGKKARQVGTYRYETKNEFVKTVPIVRILDK